MAKKKDVPQSISQEEHNRVQQIIEHYHQIAQKLRNTTDQEQVETALSEINTLPEGTQIVLLKSLAKERHVDGADILLALNELGLQKSVC